MYITWDYVRTIPGILKLVQIIFGTICVGLVGFYFDANFRTHSHPDLFFLFMTVTCLLGTFCLLISYIIRFASQPISKTNYEVIYHIFCTLLLICGSSVLLSGMSSHKALLQNGQIVSGVKATVEIQGENVAKVSDIETTSYPHKANIAAAVFGIFNALVYGVSAFFAFRDLSK